MTTIESAAPAHGARRDVTTLCAVMFTATSFLSALLLFCIEPMFSKMVLPVLGGTSAVWSVAMVVFQGLLLAGYVYAWAITKWLSLRAAMLLHLGLLLAASFCLPVAISAPLGEPPSQNIALWLIALFLTSIGLPFFAVAANAPLLQAWFARTSDANARNAYFLYRASNFGSFMVLLAYPLAIEPVWGLASQSRLWSMGYALLALGIAACATLTLSSGVRANLQTQTIAMARSGIRWRDRGAWMLLGLIPSGLLVAVTAHISTDVASAPFLWIAPLALYLLTFVLAFTDKPLIPLKWLIAVQPITIVALAFMLLWYPLLVLAAFAMRPDLRGRAAKDWITDIGFVLAIAVTLGAGYFAVKARSPELGLKFYATCVITVAMILPFLMRRPILIVSLSAILFLVTSFYPPGQDIVYRERSFFGVYKVLNKDDGAYHVFFHGTTTHGTEQVRDDNGKPVTGPPAPLAYYYRGGALGNATEAVRAAHALNHVAVVGLGVGAMSCYRQPGEAWTFYELDPLVVRFATDRKLFRSFSTCAPHAPVVLGDARLTLKTAPRGTDLLILDAFTSDYVPVHLLTKEASAHHKWKLSLHGVIVFRIDNRNLELADVVAASAAANGMAVAVHMGHAPTNAHRMVTAPEVAVVAQSAADLAGLKLDAGWKPRAAPAGFRVWTDDYSNILGVLLQRLAG